MAKLTDAQRKAMFAKRQQGGKKGSKLKTAAKALGAAATVAAVAVASRTSVGRAAIAKAAGKISEKGLSKAAKAALKKKKKKY